MYVRPRVAGDLSTGRDKPRVLIILQGAHHLMLYENIFRYCTRFQWFCLVPGLASDQELTRMHFCYGLRFFSDPYACLAHFGQFDAVITTWAVPHRKHLPYLKFVALAHELGLPVFELQHGLFQIGVTYDEDTPVIGSRAEAAMAAPDAPNLTSNVLAWSGDDGIGYPRTPTFDNLDVHRPAPGSQRVVFVTNHHWSILTDAERRHCYEVMYETIRAHSAVEFVLLPHSGELKAPPFIEMLAKLKAITANNYRIEKGRDRGVFDKLLCSANLIVGSVSTTLLDCELSGTPTVLFFNRSQELLISAFPNVVTFKDSAELIGIVEDVLFRNFRPVLTTGCAEPFRPEHLTAILEASIAGRRRQKIDDVAVAISRYLELPA